MECDEYFKFSLDTDRRLVLRIRTKNDKSTYLTFKGSSKHPQDIAWQEWEEKVTDVETLKNLLLSNGLERVVTIEKNRHSYSFDDFSINVDSIKGLGMFVEVELISDDVEHSKKRIESLLQKLNIHKEHIITQGYVPLMIAKQKELV